MNIPVRQSAELPDIAPNVGNEFNQRRAMILYTSGTTSQPKGVRLGSTAGDHAPPLEGNQRPHAAGALRYDGDWHGKLCRPVLPRLGTGQVDGLAQISRSVQIEGNERQRRLDRVSKSATHGVPGTHLPVCQANPQAFSLLLQKARY
ncbi:MAG: hypothetical protein ABSH13_05750 [Candidatus Acidiferrum sp.]|jgi:hypothetical protein